MAAGAVGAVAVGAVAVGAVAVGAVAVASPLRGARAEWSRVARLAGAMLGTADCEAEAGSATSAGASEAPTGSAVSDAEGEAGADSEPGARAAPSLADSEAGALAGAGEAGMGTTECSLGGGAMFSILSRRSASGRTAVVCWMRASPRSYSMTWIFWSCAARLRQVCPVRISATRSSRSARTQILTCAWIREGR